MKKILKNLKYIKLKDILSIFPFLFALPFALVFRIIHRNYWIVSENYDEARDNGYWFFKYVTENHPRQKICYAISKNASDRKKVEKLGKVINFGSFLHYVYYLGSTKKISAHKGSKPNAALFNYLEVFGILRNKRYFLQHGVIINDCKWLYYNETKFKMFVCGAQPEYEFVKEHFGYSKDAVKYLGLCRYDNLHNQVVKKGQILLMPTWRNWIARDYRGNHYKKDFLNTDYYKYWNEFLNSKTLHNLLEKHNKTLVFYPHYNMQQFLSYFNINSTRIIVANKANYDVQQLLMESELLITDYSSVFTDFAYMKKPVVFYQFDHHEFSKKQYHKGYFNYKTSKLAKWSDNVEDTFKNLQTAFENDCKIDDEAMAEIESFFKLYDNKNCQRNYNAIKNN